MLSFLSNFRSHFARLLNWFERIIRTDIRYLLRGGSWLLTGHGVSMVSSLALAIVFANLLPSHVYGTYKYVLSIAGILAVFTLPGINTYLAQAVARGAEKTLLPSIRLRISWGLGAAVLALGGAVYYFFNANIELAISLSIVALFIPFFDALGLYNTYLQGKRLFKISIQYFSSTQVASTACLIGAAFLTNNLFLILLAYFIPVALLRLWFLLRTLQKYPPQGEHDKRVGSYGTHLSLVSIPNQISAYLDSILLFHYLGPVQLAIYTFSLAPIEQIRGLYKNISPLALPKLASRTFAEINRLLRWRMFWLSIIGIIIAGVYIWVAPFAFSLLFPKYMSSVFISQLLAGLIALRLPGTFFASVMQSQISFLPKSWLYFSAVPSSAFIVLLLVLTPLYGVYGIIASKYVSLVVGGIISTIQWQILSRRHP